MVLSSIQAALGQILSPPLRAAFMKTLGLTLLGLVVLWILLVRSFNWLAMPSIEDLLAGMPSWVGWFGTIAAVAASVGLALALALLIAPVSAALAGLFLDDVAEAVERSSYPADAPGRPLPPLRSIVLSLKFLGVVLAGNLLALALLFVPGINLAAFFLVNGYLLGREYFEFAAMRFRPEEEAKALRRAHSGTVMIAGLAIAAFLAIPIVNLLTPLFAAATMVHLHKRIGRASRTASRATI